MMTTASRCTLIAVLAAMLLAAGPFRPARAADRNLDICALVSAEQLTAVYRKPLYPTPSDNGCFWSLEPGTMAYLDIGVHDRYQPLRQYFNQQLSSQTTLEPITDLGDEGLMSVSSGEVGVVIIRKGDRVLRSAATFLDIEVGSGKQEALWAIYRAVVERM